MILVVYGDHKGTITTLSFVNEEELGVWLQTLPHGIECVYRLLDNMTNRVLIVRGHTMHFSPVTMPRYAVVE